MTVRLHKDFIGGNIQVLSREENSFRLEVELRDTTEDWFYWAFCVEGAQGQTLTFQFGNNRLGYYGPAVSHDLKSWHWLEQVENNSFTYTFGPDEDRVYFAHHMLYHPERFLKFAENHGLTVEPLCENGAPMVQFGAGERVILLTARHHACESTGDYVLEGVLEGLLAEPVPNSRVICVPFVDYPGVLAGDQGKYRAPRDHNQDYPLDAPSIHPETAAIRKLADETGVYLAFDFHSPWHISGDNDHVFIVQNDPDNLKKLIRFGEILEQCTGEDSLKYYQRDDYPPNTGWNDYEHHTLGNFYMHKRCGTDISFVLETTYFGLPENRFTPERAVALGRAFARAMVIYDQEVCHEP